MLLFCLHGERENMLQMKISTDDIQPVCIPYDFWEFNGRLRILIFVKENIIVILKDQILLKVLQSLGQINFVKTLTHLLTSLWADKEPCYAHWLHFCGNTQVI